MNESITSKKIGSGSPLNPDKVFWIIDKMEEITRSVMYETNFSDSEIREKLGEFRALLTLLGNSGHSSYAVAFQVFVPKKAPDEKERMYND